MSHRRRRRKKNKLNKVEVNKSTSVVEVQLAPDVVVVQHDLDVGEVHKPGSNVVKVQEPASDLGEEKSAPDIVEEIQPVPNVEEVLV